MKKVFSFFYTILVVYGVYLFFNFLWYVSIDKDYKDFEPSKIKSDLILSFSPLFASFEENATKQLNNNNIYLDVPKSKWSTFKIYSLKNSVKVEFYGELIKTPSYSFFQEYPNLAILTFFSNENFNVESHLRYITTNYCLNIKQWSQHINGEDAIFTICKRKNKNEIADRKNKIILFYTVKNKNLFLLIRNAVENKKINASAWSLINNIKFKNLD